MIGLVMIRHTRDFLDSKLGHSFDAKFSSLQGKIRFDIRGEGHWLLSIDHGSLDLEKSDQPAQATLHFNDQTMVNVLNQKSNLLATFLRGDIQVEGDQSLAAATVNYFRQET